MTYEAMSEDLLGFVKSINESDIDLLGHSMGGKIAMIFALSNVSTFNYRTLIPIINNA